MYISSSKNEIFFHCITQDNSYFATKVFSCERAFILNTFIDIRGFMRISDTACEDFSCFGSGSTSQYGIESEKKRRAQSVSGKF